VAEAGVTRHYVVACEDAGAAAFLAPVLDVLRARGDRLSFWLGAVAAATFRERGLAEGVVPLENADAIAHEIHGSPLLRNATALLTGTTHWGLRLEAHAAVEAQKQGLCPTLSVLDFWSNYEARLSFPASTGFGALVGQLAVVDDAMKDELLQAGAPAEKLVITGSPAFDITLAQRGTWRPAGRRILFVSQPLESLYGRSLGYTERDVLEALASVAAEAKAELVIRPHPREDAAALESLAKSLSREARLDSARDLIDAVREARVVVGMTTMALVHAALLGAVTYSVQLDRVGDDPLATNRVGLTLPITTRAELRKRVFDALAAPVDGAQPPLPLGWAPGATARVVAALDALVR
jgi:hypothetical protein